MRKRFEVYIKFSAILTISIGFIVILGWHLDISVLKSVLPGLATMKMNTAACFILCGVSLLLFQVKPEIKIASYLKQASALIITIVGALTLCEYFFGWDLGIDQLLYNKSLVRTDPSFSGRIAFITALNFLLIGLSLLLLYRGRYLRTLQVFLLIVVSNSLLALMGYAYGVESLYGIYFYSTLALHSAILFIILAVGILCMRPEQGLMEIITSDTAGGVVVRRLLPAAVMVPFLMGWLRLLGEQAGAYGFEFGLALFALSNIIVFAILVVWSGRHFCLLDIECTRAKEELLKISTAVEQSADSVVITDKEGIIQYVNSAFTKIFGYSKEEAIGRTTRIIKSGLYPPEFYKKLWKTILSGKVFCETLINKRKDGELIYELKTITPIKDKEGNITHFIATAKEITEQKRAEQEIIFQKNRFAQLFENSPIAIALLNAQDKVVVINESFSNLFDYYLEEIKEKSLTDLIVPPELIEETNNCSEQTREGNQINRECYRKKKDGTLVYVHIIGIPIIINEKLVGIYGMYMDLTQRKEAEEKMRVAKELAEKYNRLKTEFLSQMSHEIRTPINVIVSNTSYLKDELEGRIGQELGSVFYSLDAAGRRIIRTIDLILNMADMQTNKYQPTPTHLDISGEILISVYNEFISSAKEKNLELSLHRKVADANIYADEYSVRQIFCHLIDNAIKYTHEGTVDITLDKDAEGKVIVRVSDSGAGMSDEFMAVMYEPFKQEEQGYSREYEGNGLGVALTKKYCEINNIELKVESKKNKGTTVTLIF